jgi:hypothetical protein
MDAAKPITFAWSKRDGFRAAQAILRFWLICPTSEFCAVWPRTTVHNAAKPPARKAEIRELIQPLLIFSFLVERFGFRFS